MGDCEEASVAGAQRMRGEEGVVCEGAWWGWGSRIRDGGREAGGWGGGGGKGVGHIPSSDTGDIAVSSEDKHPHLELTVQCGADR